jgi:DNA repair and recombination protein RAD54 and RAD54-like protein
MAGALHSLCQLGLGDSRNWLTNHICTLRVSFVFTNQVDGNLFLIESVERSATLEPNEVAATGEKGVGKISSPSKPERQSLLGKNLKMMGFNLKNSSLKYPIKSRTTSPKWLLGLKNNSSLDHQSQTKRLHVASDNSDDDFV